MGRVVTGERRCGGTPTSGTAGSGPRWPRRWRPAGRRSRRPRRPSGARAWSRASEPLVRPRAMPNTPRPRSWWRQRPLAVGQAEGDAGVGRGVDQGGGEQGDQVGGLGREVLAQPDEQHDVGDGAEHPDRGEPHHLSDQPDRRVHRGLGLGLLAQGRQREPARRERPADPPHALEVGDGGGDDVDPRVGVVDPVDGHLVDAQPGPLGQHQQLGVEEPAGVLHQREQGPRPVGPDGLEPALGVGEAGAEGGAQDQVVGAGDQLPLRAPDHPRHRAQSAADGHVGVARHQRRDEREQGVEVGRQVDVEIGEHGGVARAPHRASGPGPGPSGRGGRPPPPGARRLRARAMSRVRSVEALSAMVMRKVNGKPIAEVAVEAAHARRRGRAPRRGRARRRRRPGARRSGRSATSSSLEGRVGSHGGHACGLRVSECRR